jgi:SAM-dependent methyltransferase
MRTLARWLARTFVYGVPGECEQCPACGSRRLYDLDVLPLRFPGRRQTGFVSGCDDCGLVFSNPLPSPDELSRFYSRDGHWRPARAASADEGVRELEEHVSGGRSWSRPFAPIRPELDVLSPPSGARVLDYGCGAGTLLDRLQVCGWETWGVEPALDVAFERHRRVATMPQQPPFDLIVANHVLEHLPDPLALLRQFAGACRPGGYLLVGVPRFDTLPIHRDYKYVINGRAHVTAYTWPCLQGLLARACWQPVAAPPDLVAQGGGRITSARLQVMARLVDTPPALPVDPAAAAREAVRAYHAAIGARSVVERIGFVRLAARNVERKRLRDKLLRKSAKMRSGMN